MADHFHVIGQRQTTIYQHGRFVDVVEVQYQTDPEGIVGTVEIPKDRYSADTVREAVESAVATAKEVHNL